MGWRVVIPCRVCVVVMVTAILVLGCLRYPDLLCRRPHSWILNYSLLVVRTESIYISSHLYRTWTRNFSHLFCSSTVSFKNRLHSLIHSVLIPHPRRHAGKTCLVCFLHAHWACAHRRGQEVIALTWFQRWDTRLTWLSWLTSTNPEMI